MNAYTRPAIDGKVTVTIGLVGAGVLDGSSAAGVPALSSNVVSVARPLHVEPAAGTVGVSHRVGIISPEGEVVAIVGASEAVGSTHELGAVISCVDRGGEDTGNGRSRGHEILEGNHDDYV